MNDTEKATSEAQMQDTDKLPVLEILCDCCDGNGRLKRAGECYECKGTGYIPTTYGRRILELFSHHQHITTDEH